MSTATSEEQENPTPTIGQKPLGSPHSKGAILAVVLVYAMFAACWILLSDKLVQLLFSDPEQIIIASMLKGWFFVGTTSLLLYFSMQQWIVEAATPTTLPIQSRHLRPSFWGLQVLIVVFTVIGISHSFKHEKTEALNRLSAVSEFKALQISEWLTEKHKSAEFIMTSEFFAEQFQAWQHKGELQSGIRLQKRLDSLRQTMSLNAIALLDNSGEVLWKSENFSLQANAVIQNAAQKASVNHTLIQLDPYQDSEGKIYLEFIAPLIAIPNATPLVVMRFDLQDWLLPTLFAWTVHEKPGQSELIIHQGKQFKIFRHSAKQLNVSNKIGSQLSAQLLDENPPDDLIIEDEDAEGNTIFGTAQRINTTQWWLVVARKQAEFYRTFAQQASWIVFVGVFALFIVHAAYYLLRQSQQLALTQAVQQAQLNQLQALELLAALADSSDDAIFAKDLQGRYILFNRAACLFINKTIDEVLGQDDYAIFPAQQAAKIQESGRLIIHEEKIICAEEELDTAIGKRVFLTTKGPLRNSDKHIIGIFGISRDITDKKRVELALRESEERLRLTIDATSDGVCDWDLRARTAFFSSNYYAIIGYRAEDVSPNFEFFKQTIFPEDLPKVLAALNLHIAGNTPLSEIEYRIITPNSGIKWLHGRCKVIERDPTGLALRMVGTITDITVRKSIEETLLVKSEELKQRNAELERFNHIMVGREIDMIELKQQVNDLSLKLNAQAPYPLAFIDDNTHPLSTQER